MLRKSHFQNSSRRNCFLVQMGQMTFNRGRTTPFFTSSSQPIKTVLLSPHAPQKRPWGRQKAIRHQSRWRNRRRRRSAIYNLVSTQTINADPYYSNCGQQKIRLSLGVCRPSVGLKLNRHVTLIAHLIPYGTRAIQHSRGCSKLAANNGPKPLKTRRTEVRRNGPWCIGTCYRSAAAMSS